jgi:hypothetical protein
MGDKFTAVYYDQRVLGVPVDSGSVTLLVRNEVGSPIVLAVNNAKSVSVNRRMGQISSKKAITNVRAAHPGLDVKSDPFMVAWTGEHGTSLAWTFLFGNDSKTDPKLFAAFVDASSGAILEMRNKVYFTDVSGHIDAMATPGLFPNQPSNPPVLTDLEDVIARIVGGGQAKTDASGNFTITHPGSAMVTVTGGLRGTWANVINDAGPNETFSLGVLPPGPADYMFNATPTEATQAQVDGYIHTQLVHNFAKSINSAYPGIDVQVPVTVNINSACNAFYTNGTINFFASGGGCANTAYSTVVYHEYGHFIIEMGNSNPSGDYHEGMADVTAALLADDPCLAADFGGEGTGCLRSSYNATVHPCVGGSHDCGQVISGAFWLTKDELDVSIGAGPALDLMRDLYLNSILLEPNDINPAVTVDVLTLDDDDPFLFNGTPHYTEIATGFGAKNLDAPPLEPNYAANGVSTIMGTHAGGGLPQIASNDNAYYMVNAVELPGLGFFGAMQVEFTIPEPPATVDRLTAMVESSVSPGNNSTGTVYFWNWTTSQFEYANAFSVQAGTDTLRAARLTSNVQKYINGGGQVRVAFRIHDPWRRDGQRPVTFTMRADSVRLFVGS